ncbi:SGNH/GDSL hydrolase family protein [Kitasatospora sp. NPDC002227]|uniref:SGNH/GDSL hydrolase family protein n=1 Tax=Kitasatospora sp. NPDC002227 TaxID=3154773 RepID=UPI00332770E2
MRHRLLAVAAALTFTFGLGAATPAAAATPASYAALGDSVAAGDGAGDYRADGTDCHRSNRSYPALWSAAKGAGEFRLPACSGATTQDVLDSQLAEVSPATTAVTLTVGGNDAGFVTAVVDCLQPFTTDAKCDAALDETARRLREDLPVRLDRTYQAVRGAAPNATVAVAGYPHLLETGTPSCAVGTEPRRVRINALADQLDDLISRQADQHGFRFADPRPAFAGHGVCATGGHEWINRIVFLSLWESFHPTAEGYRLGYLPAVTAALG